MWANINTAYYDLLETDREDGGCAASHGYSFTECVEVTSHQPAASHLTPEVPGNTDRLQDTMVPDLHYLQDQQSGGGSHLQLQPGEDDCTEKSTTLHPDLRVFRLLDLRLSGSLRRMFLHDVLGPWRVYSECLSQKVSN